MAQIDYWFTPLSPWCYLGGDRLERIAERHGTVITYRPVDALQLFDRTGGQHPEARHHSRMDYRAQELARWAGHLEMPINLKPGAGRPNPAPAAYAVIAAQATGGDVGPLVRAILRAHWVEERDIADDATLRAILADTGFNPALIDSGLLLGAETYARNLEAAVEGGVFGVPFYVVTDTGQKFWGQDRLDALDRHLAEA